MPVTPWINKTDRVDPNLASYMNQAYAELKAAAMIAFYSRTTTLTDTDTLTDESFPIQFLDPGGAGRIVELPAEAVTNHLFFIFNAADAAEDLTVKDDGGATIAVLSMGEAAFFVSNGIVWKHS